RKESAEGTRYEIEIPEDSPAFRGHFPGRPILPGVAQLALVEQGLAALAGRPQRIAEISGVRLRKTVGPGETLELLLRNPTEDGGVRFEIRTHGEPGEPVSGGLVRAAAPGKPDGSERKEKAPGGKKETGGLTLPAAAPTESEGEKIEAAGRVPHAPPALLVARLVWRRRGEARAEGIVPIESPFASGGSAPAFLGLEIAAQTAALLEALGREGEAPGPRAGYLVAIRHARCPGEDLPVGVPLDAFVKETGSATPLTIYEARVELAGRTLVEGSISTWIAEG
ncbi:MAG TPA: hypothetical protein VN851_11985, partial [Thermoanaerobaculia bacterium]|nr:hypothetical protein [Thermoanaerobaculia bacterium]